MNLNHNVTSRKFNQINYSLKICFQNLFIAELKSFPAIRRPDTKPNPRPDTEINHRLNFPCSPCFSCASLLVNATPGTRPAPRIPPAPPFLFLLFPLFPFSLFSFSPFLFPSPFFLLLPPATCPRAARAAHCSHALHAHPGCSLRRSPLPDPSRHPVPPRRSRRRSATPSAINGHPRCSPAGHRCPLPSTASPRL